MEFSIRPITADDWAEYRTIRLEMLQDSPTAFLERFSTARRFSDDEWKRRAARFSSATSIRLAAISADSEWVGSMGACIPDGATEPVLVAVYVTPAWRGDAAGVTDALLLEVEAWASARSDSIILEVHEDNARAMAAYLKRGYVATGNRRPYDLDPRRDELEMRKILR